MQFEIANNLLQYTHVTKYGWNLQNNNTNLNIDNQLQDT